LKLFQIEEPEGGPADPGGPGAAVGVDASGSIVEVSFAVGGNALVLADREGFEQVLPVPDDGASAAEWRGVFEAARMRAERALARPVTHAVLIAGTAEGEIVDRLRQAAEQAGLAILRVVARTELPAGSTPAFAAAVLAEDLAPRPEPDDGPGSDTG
jgi:hypothetical protein